MSSIQDAHLQKGHFFDIIGKVTNDLKLRMLMSTDFGTNIGKLECSYSRWLERK